jgi:hypothetical protein
MVRQHVRRQRQVEDNVDDYEEGNPNTNLQLGDYVAIKNDIVQGARHWVQPKQSKFRAETTVTYNIAAVVKMTYQPCTSRHLTFELRLKLST